MNQLASASSSYLRSASHQPVNWRPWGAEAFAAAAAENKPVLLDIGAVWCHWCHVMDRESYEDPAVAALINEHYIPVKVDRDERPDVDSRYQSAVSAISGQGGWPLTVFLTPEGKPFFGGTYFPPADHYGRPGFPRVLATMVDVFQNKTSEMQDSAASVMAAIRHNESFAGRSGELSKALLEKMIASVLSNFDPREGGFGSQPKFPHPAALDLLLDHAARTGDAPSRHAAIFTLKKMARGGMRDQLAGGFHRYSVDEHWTVPHFEKMAYDNAELLRNYVHAYTSFGDDECAETAREIVRWMNEWLSDQQQGGFYASQDADISLDDDGDYFTWTLAEVRAALSPEEAAIAVPYFNVAEVGDMHHDPARNVLNTPEPLTEIAAKQGITAHAAEELLASARVKLSAVRAQRQTPFIDKSCYTSWNALCIGAYLEAAAALDLPAARTFALKSLDRILRETWEGERLLHVASYSGSAAPQTPVAGMLDDYAYMVHACVEAWQATVDSRYYTAAVAIAGAMIAKLYDPVTPGFFDSAQDADAVGALSIPRKPLQDSPTPAGNPAAAAALLRLHALGAGDRYRDIAEQTLESFAGVVEHFGLYAGTYALALTRLLMPDTQIAIVGEDDVAAELAKAACGTWLATRTVLRLTHEQAAAGGLPPALAETLPHLPSRDSVALVCTGRSCLPPITDPAALRRLLNAAASDGIAPL